jgi:hypothetical protein
MSEDEEKIDALVVEVQTLQQYFPKPTLKTKYLKRAPFPFLHDIFWGAAKGCGFGAGLFGDSKFKPPKVSGLCVSLLYLCVFEWFLTHRLLSVFPRNRHTTALRKNSSVHVRSRHAH